MDPAMQGAPMPVAPGPQQPPIPGEPMDPFAAMAMGQQQPPPMDPMLMQALMGGGGMPMGDGDMDAPMDLMGMGMPGMGMADPYAVPPGYSQQALSGAGVADPQMGLQQLLQMLALAQSGVAPGSPVTSSSGVMPDPSSNIMAGFDPMASAFRTGGY